MANTTAKVRALILAGLDFNNTDQLAAIETLATASAVLADAGNEFDDVNPAGSADSIAQGALDLAEAFSKVADPDKNTFVKSAFNQVFSADTPESEAAGESLFAAALDFNIAASAVNALFTTTTA